MLILPAIDMLGGKCVRLSLGNFEDVTFYGNPMEQLAAFEAKGAQWVHVVDLDGAREGRPVQHEALRGLARSTRLQLQCGGGVRRLEDVQALLDAGVARVVVGSAAVTRAEQVREWISNFGGDRICCAFDVRPAGDGFEVMVKGWAQSGGASLRQALDLYPPGELAHALVTDVSRDGVLTGPNVTLMRTLAASRPDLSVQASGGVSALADLASLREAGAAAAIVGRALYEQRFTLEDALAL